MKTIGATESFANRDLGVEREILDQLREIIVTPQIMVITGLRRVGKSTLLAQIAKKYLKDDYYFVNFEDERLLNFQVTDFDLLHETLISLFGEKQTFLFDEIQNVPEWERFVRRLHDQVKSLKELTFYLISNSSTLISFNKLKELLKLGSVNTVKNYIDYLENSWLFFVVNKYAYSVKEQQIAAKKIYGVDTGLINSVGFSFSENKGRLIENIVYLQLRRKQQDIVITESDKQTLKREGGQISVVPLYEWLLK